MAALGGAGVYLRAFGAGSNAFGFLANLQRIDPRAQVFTRPEQLVEFFGGPTGSLSEPEHGLAGIALYLDPNNNGEHDSDEPMVVSSGDDSTTSDVDEAGRYCFEHLTAGTSVVRALPSPGFSATYPAALSGHIVSGAHIPLVSGLDFGLARRSQLGLAVSASGAVSLSLVFTLAASIIALKSPWTSNTGLF